MTLTELTDRFPDEATAKTHLFNLRWPAGKVACPRCGKDEKIYRRAPRKDEAVSYRWTCKSCNKNGYGFSLTTGTIFEEAKLPLHKFFQILLLMLTSKKGMSARQVQRTVFGETRNRKGWIVGKGSYESTWYACHRIRAAMRDEHFLRLTGAVEIDETYVGGSDRNRHKNKRRGTGMTEGAKVPVIGAIARKGNVVCEVLDRVTGNVMDDFVMRTVDEKVSLVATDEHKGYARLRQAGYPHVTDTVSSRVSLVATDEHKGYARLSELGYPHETVTHSKGEYVRGQVHTANLDAFWSLVKRGIMGSFHQVSRGYLPLYLNEFSYRHNNRGRYTHDVFDRVLESC